MLQSACRIRSCTKARPGMKRRWKLPRFEVEIRPPFEVGEIVAAHESMALAAREIERPAANSSTTRRWLQVEPLEREIAELIVACTGLEDVRAADIDPDAPLFVEGLGLDSNRCARDRRGVEQALRGSPHGGFRRQPQAFRQFAQPGAFCRLAATRRSGSISRVTGAACDRLAKGTQECGAIH